MIESVFKIVIVGDSGVGKSTIIRRLCKGEFKQQYQPTIGVEFATKTYHMDGYDLKIQLWDTAGLERYRSIVSAHYRRALGAVIVFDITQPKTFEAIPGWIDDLLKNNSENLLKVIIGNKTDLECERLVSKEVVQILAEKYDCLYFETSALADEGIQQLFELMTNQMYQRQNGLMEPIKVQQAPQETVNIQKQTQVQLTDQGQTE